MPEGWAWCRVASVTSILTDGEHKTPHRCESFKGFYLLSARNIRDGFIALDDVDYVDEQEYERISARWNPKRNDVLISCSGTVPARRERSSPVRASRTITWPLCQRLLYAANWLRGLSFFAFRAKPGGRMTQENDTTTELQLWFSGAWGRSLPTSFCRSY